MTDWREWHAAYDDPQSSLARRLTVVRHHVAHALASRNPKAPWRILSLCAGDARDLLPELANTDHQSIHTVLIERDVTLAQDARGDC